MLRLAVESWIWYAVALAITICRFVSRSLTFRSIKKLQVDDWLMVFAICSYTTLVVTMNIVANVQTNLLEPGFDFSKLTRLEVAARQHGSKMVIVVEQMQCVTVWALKATLLIMYYRLTIALKENLAVKLLAVYTGLTFVVMEILYLGVWCRPFHNYWAVPTPNVQCNAATNHLITNAVFNISSDLVMLCIGLSLFARSRLPWKRKIILLCIFSLGIFVILCAALNKYYSFTEPFGSMWTFWYIRECSTAVLVANLPYTWTLLRRVFKLGAFDQPTEGSSIQYHSSRSARGRMTRPDPHHTDLRSKRRSGTGNNSGGRSHHSHHSSWDAARKDRPKSGDKQNHPSWYGRHVEEAHVEPWDIGHEWTPQEKALLAEPVRRPSDIESGGASSGATGKTVL